MKDKAPVNPLVVAQREKAEKLAQAQIAERRRLALSFDFVFDQPKLRNEHQKRVLEHLSLCAGEQTNSYDFNASTDGLTKIAAGIHRDGAQSILKVIHRQLANAANLKGKK